MPDPVADAHQSDHDYSTGHTPDHSDFGHDEEEQEVQQEEVHQGEDEQGEEQEPETLEMLHDGRVVIKPSGKE